MKDVYSSDIYNLHGFIQYYMSNIKLLSQNGSPLSGVKVFCASLNQNKLLKVRKSIGMRNNKDIGVEKYFFITVTISGLVLLWFYFFFPSNSYD